MPIYLSIIERAKTDGIPKREYAQQRQIDGLTKTGFNRLDEQNVQGAYSDLETSGNGFARYRGKGDDEYERTANTHEGMVSLR